jgi:heme-degrading monooxygenase HmoA
MVPLLRSSFFAALLLLSATTAFTLVHPSVTRIQIGGPHFLSSVTDEDVEVTTKGILKRDRYVATNRFSVRKDKQGKFEKRWATRKSRLASLEGFKYFHLMRRVNLSDDGTVEYDGGESDDDAFGNYVSFTIWEKKSHFSAWRKGDAFKEAHGGTSITAFLSTMVNSAFVLRGAPRPAFYDAILLQKNEPKTVPETVDGWRQVEADGENTLPVECFVACNQFFVPAENAAAFEQRWADRETKLKECEGFVSFKMLRRDGTAKGHGTSPMSDNEPSYVSTTIWENRAAFDSWRNGNGFQQAHGQKKEGEAPKGPPAPLWSKPPQPVFYEGTLVITTKEGA